MIKHSEVLEVGVFMKPHGLHGEITVMFDFDDIDVSLIKCLIVEIDSILVPFFINSIRPKTSETFLVRLDGIDTDEKVTQFSGCKIFILKSDAEICGLLHDDDVVYLKDLIGFDIVDNEEGRVGKFADYDDSTENVVCKVLTDEGKSILLPFVDDFIDEISLENKRVIMSLPVGLLDLNAND